MAPKRDIVATDGMKITLGGETVTVWLTPGHTPGTMSYTFTVLDRGKPVNVAYSGGTAFNFVNNTPDPGIKNFQTYIDSQKRMAASSADRRRPSCYPTTPSSTTRSTRTACSPAAATDRIPTKSAATGCSGIFR